VVFRRRPGEKRFEWIFDAFINQCKEKSLLHEKLKILPGIILPRLKDDLARQNLPPIIAGGLIRTEKEIKEVLKSGALAISTSRKELWGFKV